MSLAEIIPLAMKASIWLIVFALGLKADLADLTYVLRRPGRLVRSLAAMSLIMPLSAAMFVKAMSAPHAVEIALVAVALAPVPPVLPKKQIKAEGHASYVLDPLFPASVRVGAAPVARLVLSTVLLPLAAGAIVRRTAPSPADRIAPVASMLGSLLLLAAVIPIAITKWPLVFTQAHDGALLAFAGFALLGLVAGHVVGGPAPDDRSVLALATASRHPGIAIAIAQMNFPDEHAIAPAVLLYLIANGAVSLPYMAWRKRAARKRVRPDSGGLSKTNRTSEKR